MTDINVHMWTSVDIDVDIAPSTTRAMYTHTPFLKGGCVYTLLHAQKHP